MLNQIVITKTDGSSLAVQVIANFFQLNTEGRLKKIENGYLVTFVCTEEAVDALQMCYARLQDRHDSNQSRLGSGAMTFKNAICVIHHSL